MANNGPDYSAYTFHEGWGSEGTQVTVNGKKGALIGPMGHTTNPKTVKGYEAYINRLKPPTTSQSAKVAKSPTQIAKEARTSKYIFKSPPKSLRAYAKNFPKGTNFRGGDGQTAAWAKPMELRHGSKPNYNWSRVAYDKAGGKIFRTNEKWGSITGKLPEDGTMILNGSDEWIRQIQIAIYQMGVQMEHYRIMSLQKAMKVFKDSFKYQKFFSSDTAKWSPLSAYTLKKRAALGHGSKILDATGALKESLEIKENAIVTKPVEVPTRYPITPQFTVREAYKNSPKVSTVYAGWHNEGKGFTGPKHNQPFKQRQFMGHSTYLDPMADKFMSQMLKRYLFDSVFMMRKK